MQYTRIGTGDYLILVHGALADEKMWYPHIESLRFEYEVRSFPENKVPFKQV